LCEARANSPKRGGVKVAVTSRKVKILISRHHACKAISMTSPLCSSDDLLLIYSTLAALAEQAEFGGGANAEQNRANL